MKKKRAWKYFARKDFGDKSIITITLAVLLSCFGREILECCYHGRMPKPSNTVRVCFFANVEVE